MSISSEKSSATSLPVWFWAVFCPVLGGLAFVGVGQKTGQKNWIYVGWGLTAVSLITITTSGLSTLIWLGQVLLALHFRKQYTKQLEPSEPSQSMISTRKQTIHPQEKVDINVCTKDELVYRLGLPIVYANTIIELRESGLSFTHVEELFELAGLPEKYLDILEPNVTFTYDFKRESLNKWESLNILSQEGLVAAGLSQEVAQRLVQERSESGPFGSLLEVIRRTHIPIKYLQKIL